MKIVPTILAGVFVIDLEPIEDHRGFFARQWTAEDFAAAGLVSSWVAGNVGSSRLAGTIRGLHYQRPPVAESKLLWCGRGEVFDVAVDLRDESPTCCQWVGMQLSADNHKALYVPPGVAHGYQTLQPDTELWYLASAPYDRAASAGARWDDPAFGIEWPLSPGPISAQDASWPLVGEQPS